ncbi:tRNA pseudouridine synthase A [anaerobic digester metagenome]
MRVAFQLGWWGAGFAGSQRQPGFYTVEGEFIRACQQTKIFTDPQRAGFLLSGRTDRGVHARAQVGALTTDHPERVGAILNRALPPEIWLTGVAPVHDLWHPRHDVRRRTYRYFFADPSLDRAVMDRAAARLVGDHDFSRLCRARSKNPVRRVFSSQVFDGDEGAVFEITAWSYLWHQVRCMAAVLEAIGRHEEGEDLVDDLLSGTCRRNPPAAPAAGLVLWEVETGFAFTPVSKGERHDLFLSRAANAHRVQAELAARLQDD